MREVVDAEAVAAGDVDLGEQRGVAVAQAALRRAGDATRCHSASARQGEGPVPTPIVSVRLACHGWRR